MDPSALTLLVEILDAGNLSRAARKLKMTRANVSYRLAQLEKQVGAQLIRRTTVLAEPTEIGKRLYEHGLVIRNELLLAEESIARLGKELEGRVGLSVPSGYGQMVMADWLIEFKRRYPGIVLDVVFENRIDNLVRDEIDIAIRVLPEPPPHLVARDMGPVRYVACATPAWAQAHGGMPQAPGQLAQLPIITSGVVGEKVRLRAYPASGAFHEVPLAPTLVSEHFPFLREGILAGLGIGLVPDYVVKDAIASGAVLTALGDYRLSIFGNWLFMLYMPGRHQTRAIRTCIDYLLECSQAAQRPLHTGVTG
ncbi:LysR family transcriptional regulator [Corticibacter populi]|uniref:LysR family transcriptional regulator n=1 Tax=Corticibacter populi TaxID=1550736 RepID=A0A3M6QNG6_9BURK|nr:LysR family transcriptional regulator [Corticibacter populi]RMX04291.1 LysR family transcriptional regulator [Corticibacter populi]RZS33338.1 DNA-binding transcriptional LysR family regulator [Corticibacter populi]